MGSGGRGMFCELGPVRKNKFVYMNYFLYLCISLKYIYEGK